MELQKRSGFIIKITTDEGTGIGEASPLKGFSRETLSDVENFLQTAESNFLNSELDSVFNNKTPASVKFAFEQAGTSIILAKKEGESPFKLNPKGEIKVNGFVPFLERREFQVAVEKFLNDGFERIKIKIGRNNFHDDLEFIVLANEIIKGSNVKLRLDANGKWDSDEAKRNLDSLQHFQIDYVEQPVEKAETLAELAGQSPVNIAADESLPESKSINILLHSKIPVFVLKPTLLGGLKPALEIYDQAISHGKEAIVSSVFESPVGLTYLIYGASLMKENLVHGIPPIEFSQNNFSELPYSFENGKVKFNLRNFPAEINLTDLK